MGIPVAIEVVGPVVPTWRHPLKTIGQWCRTSYPHSTKWAEEMADLELPATLDTTHVAAWHREPANYVRMLGTDLRHIHLSDYNMETGQQHRVPGTGHIAFDLLFRELTQHGYHGYITLELSKSYAKLGMNALQEAVERSVDYLRQFIPQPDAPRILV